MMKKRRIGEVSALYFFPLLLLVSCSSTNASEQKNNPTLATIDDKVLSQSGGLITTVTTGLVLKKDFEYLINTSGKIKSQREQLVTNEIGGLVLDCRAKTGAFFQEGSQILQMETTAIRYKLERAELAKFNGEKEYTSQLLSYDNLLKDKSGEQAESIRRKLRIASGLAVAEQDIREMNHELEKTVIRAPFSGVLADVKVLPGGQLRPGQEIFRIYDPTHLLLEVKILETDVALLHPGTPAEVTTIADASFRYKAYVSEINPYVDESGMILVKLRIDKTSRPSAPLFPGMNCTSLIRISLGRALVVPKGAIVMRNDKPVIFTFEDGKAKWNYVTPGRENGEETEIIKGLSPGQKIIISNNLQLAHDAAVNESVVAAHTGN
jgi:RND family efflux transporter MFP subunit